MSKSLKKTLLIVGIAAAVCAAVWGGLTLAERPARRREGVRRAQLRHDRLLGRHRQHQRHGEHG